MKAQIIGVAFAGILLLNAGCTGSATYPVVTADAEHHFELNRATEPPPYEIRPAAGIQLDIGQFQFTANGASVTPDTVQVWSHSQRYRLAQPLDSTVVTLDTSTLTNGTSADPFPGFNPGDRVMINVGRTQPLPHTPENMTYDWEALVLVK